MQHLGSGTLSQAVVSSVPDHSHVCATCVSDNGKLQHFPATYAICSKRSPDCITVERLTAVDGLVLDFAIVVGHNVSLCTMDADDSPMFACDHTH